MLASVIYLFITSCSTGLIHGRLLGSADGFVRHHLLSFLAEIQFSHIYPEITVRKVKIREQRLIQNGLFLIICQGVNVILSKFNDLVDQKDEQKF